MTKLVKRETCEHEVKYDFSDVMVDEDTISITGSCNKCDTAFMATFREPLYSILDDNNEWQNYDKDLVWAD